MSEKPYECSKCQRDACIEYKEIKDGTIHCYSMCKNCPYLKEKMLEESKTACVFSPKAKCQHCGQTAEEFQVSLTLGCASCVDTFSDLLENELVSQDILCKSFHENTLEKYHFGKVPKNVVDPSFSKTLESLHLALNVAVSNEKFEEAADIQNQIKQYMEKKDEAM